MDYEQTIRSNEDLQEAMEGQLQEPLNPEQQDCPDGNCIIDYGVNDK